MRPLACLLLAALLAVASLPAAHAASGGGRRLHPMQLSLGMAAPL